MNKYPVSCPRNHDEEFIEGAGIVLAALVFALLVATLFVLS